MDEFGSVSFAPTADQAQDAVRRGQLEGIPQAIKVLSLRLPRVLGVKAPAAPDLLNAPGAGGVDPFLSEVIKTLAKTLAPMGMPQGFGGMPDAPRVIPGAGTPPPRPIFQDNPPPKGTGGTAGPPMPPSMPPPRRPWYKDVPHDARMI